MSGTPHMSREFRGDKRLCERREEVFSMQKTHSCWTEWGLLESGFVQDGPKTQSLGDNKALGEFKKSRLSTVEVGKGKEDARDCASRDWPAGVSRRGVEAGSSRNSQGGQGELGERDPQSSRWAKTGKDDKEQCAGPLCPQWSPLMEQTRQLSRSTVLPVPVARPIFI